MSAGNPIDMHNAVVPGLGRRLAAIGYDCLVLAALLVLAAAIVVLPFGLYTGREIDPSSPWYRLYLLLVCACFFCWFWIRGGQTVGMRAWRIRLVRSDGTKVRFRDAVIRLLAAGLSWACLGLGFTWVLFDRRKLAWHDRLSGTQLVMLEKQTGSPPVKKDGTDQ